MECQEIDQKKISNVPETVCNGSKIETDCQAMDDNTISKVAETAYIIPG